MLFLCLSDYVFVNFKIVRLVCLCLFWLQSLISPKNADCGKRLQNCDTNLYNVDEMTTIWGDIFFKKIHFTVLKRDFGKISRRFRPLLFRFDMRDSTGFPARRIYLRHTRPELQPHGAIKQLLLILTYISIIIARFLKNRKRIAIFAVPWYFSRFPPVGQFLRYRFNLRQLLKFNHLIKNKSFIILLKRNGNYC